MKEIVFLGNDEAAIRRVFGLGQLERVHALGNVLESVINGKNPERYRSELATVKYAFSTWGMPNFTVEEIKEYFPSLECVFYAAGSVQAFARNFLACGVRVFSAWTVNAIPVAETVFAQITLCNKGFFHTLGCAGYDEKLRAALPFSGNFAANVGLIGAGMIGSMVAEKLKMLSVNVFVYDPFLSDERAKQLGVQKLPLQELFARCDVISNHLADNEQTRGMLGYDCFSRMKERAVFINSGRGRQVDEQSLVRALKEVPTRFAVLDVTYPEPPEVNSELYSMKNVLLTPHIDGSWGNEVVRMADCMIDAFLSVKAGKSSACEVTKQMLATMA